MSDLQSGGVVGRARTLRRGSRRVVQVVVVLVVLVAFAGFLGYNRGQHAARTVTVSSGLAYASPVQAEVEDDGWIYNIPLDITWYSPDGTENEGSRPSCLPPDQRTSLTFGYVSYYRDGALNRTIVWVRC
jgi:hypothetical protein